MSRQTAVSTGTPQRLLFGAGVYFAGVSYSDTTAPTKQTIASNIIGATKDGGTLTITPEFYDPEIDDVLVKVKEFQHKIGETATMEVSFAELIPDVVNKMVIGDYSAPQTADTHHIIKSAEDIASGHYYSGFGFYGELLDGRQVTIIFKTALCTSGFTTDPKSKDIGVFKGTFECVSDISTGITKLPYAIFIEKESTSSSGGSSGGSSGSGQGG